MGRQVLPPSAIPALVPVVLMSLDGARSRLDPTPHDGSPVHAIVAVSAVLVGPARGVGEAAPIPERRPRRAVHDLADGRVVVTNFESLGRFTWKDAVHGRFLSVPESDLGTVAARLADEDIDEFVFAAPYRQETDRARLEGYEPVDGLTRTVGEWELSVMRRSTE